MNLSNHIAILGAESSGKSELAMSLAKHYDGLVITEYAREYMTDGNISYENLDHIAQVQMQKENDYFIRYPDKILFIDTEYINLKIWFSEVFHKTPQWFDDIDPSQRYGYYLLTENDLEWVYDPLRSYPDKEDRDYLRKQYENEIVKSGTPYGEVYGTGESRTRRAIELIDRFHK